MEQRSSAWIIPAAIFLVGGCRVLSKAIVDFKAMDRFMTVKGLTSADLLHDRVLPFFDNHGLPMLRILTDRGTEYCGKAESDQRHL